MKIKYPLLSNAFSKKDIDIGIKVLKSKFITMSKYTESFEKAFAKKLNFKYALMTNSGSSANLLAMSALVNPIRKKRLRKNDHVLIPAVCWSTSLWPIIQNGLKPVFVDVDLNTFNISLEDLQRKITKKTKAIMCIHILGTSTNMQKLSLIAKKNNLTIIEDTCESLGTKYKKNFLGSFGDFGTFSFYYSHQITCGEGGMIVCQNKDDYNILKTLRSHGWSRNTDFEKKLKNKYKNIDNRFMFLNSGYNLRPTDVQAAIGLSQFKRLEYFKKIRKDNRSIIIESLISHKSWNNQFSFVSLDKQISPSWFGLAILLNSRYKSKKKKFLKYLDKVGIENRPILSGNFINQPSVKLYNLNPKKINFPNAQKIEDLGFFIGLQTEKITKKISLHLSNHLLKIDEI
tara:strand:- start:256 stop:1458 length:1203 start_codon:yes stop_codon:yes gene_type:complete